MSREDALCRLAEAHGASINRQGGVYVNGEAYSFTKKLEVAAAYQAARDENGGERPNISNWCCRCRHGGAYSLRASGRAGVDYLISERRRIGNIRKFLRSRKVSKSPAESRPSFEQDERGEPRK